ncbi:MAG: hypothetical protein Ct9H90mP22_4380 [Gammaproteobacteria bacterium]|nr:MAG: hypothetical protein Ct9H90mP22_4380 [Gammaproteobacteria bacterium]
MKIFPKGPLSKLTNINVKHQCGKNNITKVRELYKKYGLSAEISIFIKILLSKYFGQIL